MIIIFFWKVMIIIIFWKVISIKSKSIIKIFIEFGYCFAEILWGQLRPHLDTISSDPNLGNPRVKQGRNQLGARGGRPPPPSKMWLYIVIARRKREKQVLSLAQYYHNTSKVSLIIINTINIDIKLKLQNFF